MIAVVALLLLPPDFARASEAGKTRWTANYDECGAWAFVKPYEDFLKKGVKWEKDKDAALVRVTRFTSDVCPHFMNRTSASTSLGVEADPENLETITLAQFVQEQAEMGTEADRSFQESEELETWIREQLDAQEKIYRKAVGGTLLDSPCAQSFLAIHRHIQSENLAMQTTIKNVAQCREIAKKLEQDKRAPAASRAHGDGGKAVTRAAGAPSGNPKNGASSITGVDEARAKEKSLAPSR